MPAKISNDVRMQRFLVRTKRDPETGCLNWTGPKKGRGYGTMTGPGRRSVLTHRWAYEQFVGPIPDGLQIDHLCKNTACVEPSHLEAVEPAENNRRSDSLSALNMRKTSCKRGHEFTPENLYLIRGTRWCRICTLARTRGRIQRRDEARMAVVLRHVAAGCSGVEIADLLGMSTYALDRWLLYHDRALRARLALVVTRADRAARAAGVTP